jgi:ribose/xylose/arabinose/galactoside ABC-type transport system permease subunit
MRQRELNAASAGTSPAAFKSLLLRANSNVGAQNWRLLIALALLVAIIASQSEYFLTTANLLIIGQGVAVVGVLAVAETVVIVSGGLDISLGSLCGLSGVVTAIVIRDTHSAGLGIGAGLAAGALGGVVNGLIITVGRVNPVIATLATLSAFEGMALLVAKGAVIGIQDETFNLIGSGRVLNLAIPIVILAVVFAIGHITMRYSVIGRHIYAIGANAVAARLSGIPVDRYKLGIYTMSGAVAGIAAMILSARATGSTPLQGQGLEFDVVTAVILGGASLAGGRGTMAGSMLAVFMIGALYNGLILAQVESYWQFIAKGVLLATAVIIQERRRRR